MKDKNNKEHVIVKLKGGFNGSISKEDFIKMYKGFDVEALKRNTITNKEKGYVVIDNKKINLRSDSYQKREKIYSDGNWVDTKPLNYNKLFSE